MQDIIKKIIEIDHMAQKMTDEAVELKKEAEISIENDKKRLRDEYIAKARERIKINSQTEEKFLQESLSEISARNAETEGALNKIYTEKKENWVNEIYDRVLGR